MMWEQLCEYDVVRKTLWERCDQTLWEWRCENDVVIKTLWERCEKKFVRKTMWGKKTCEIGVVRNTLRKTLLDRHYFMPLKPRNGPCTCFISRHGNSLTFGVRFGSAPSTMFYLFFLYFFLFGWGGGPIFFPRLKGFAVLVVIVDLSMSLKMIKSARKAVVSYLCTSSRSSESSHDPPNVPHQTFSGRTEPEPKLYTPEWIATVVVLLNHSIC